ncbi:MAG: hypothetical protein HDR34_00625 [Treponema sp.]|nr:hypothetical protein [Treponema sp.]
MHGFKQILKMECFGLLDLKVYSPIGKKNEKNIDDVYGDGDDTLCPC